MNEGDRKEYYSINDFSSCYDAEMGNALSRAVLHDKNQLEYRVLCHGVIHLKDVLFPWLSSFLRELSDEKVHLDILQEDENPNSENAVKELFEPWVDKQNYIFDKGVEKQKISKIYTHQGKVMHYEIGDNLIIKKTEEDKLFASQPYDLIFSGFKLHFSLNWRVKTFRLLEYLKPGGTFCYTEVIGDFSLLDGNFKNKYDIINTWEKENNDEDRRSRRDFLYLMEQFDKRRIDAGFYWRPEIRMTDYSALTSQIKPFFKDICSYRKSKLSEHPPTTFKTIIRQWVRKRMTSYFKIGVSESKDVDMSVYEDILKTRAEKRGEKGDVLDQEIKLKKGFKLYVAKGYKSFTRIIGSDEGQDYVNHWSFNNQLRKVQKINDNEYDTLGKKVIDILVSHDLFFPEHTYYCAILGWDENKGKRVYPIHLAVNNSLSSKAGIIEKVNGFGMYISRKEGLDFLLDEFIFKNIKRKFPVSFQILKEEGDSKEGVNLDICQSIELSGIGPKPAKLYFKFSYDDKGDVEQLRLFLPKIFRLKEGNLSKNIGVNYGHNSVEEDLFEIGVKEERSVINESVIYRKIIKKSIEDNKASSNVKQISVEELSEKYGIKLHFDHKQYKYNQYTRGVGNLFFEHLGILEKDHEHKQQTRKLVVTLYCVATFLLREERGGDRVTIFPSGLIRIKDDERTRGHGGIIVYEKIPSSESEKEKKELHVLMKSMMESRNYWLEQVSNLLFSKANIASYVNVDYIGKSLQAAIASIIARNGSHGLGSHVLPKVSHSAQNPFDNQLLFTYLEQRFDFIAQVATEFPSWTFPTWFNNDLMMRFYMQRQILRNLVKAEKLDAYEFNLEGGIKELLWENEKFQNGTLETGFRCIMFGFLNKTQQGEYRLFQKKTLNESSRAVSCYFALPQTIKNGTPLRVIGDLHKTQEGYELRKAKPIDNKLVLKVRKRTFVTVENGHIVEGSESAVSNYHYKDAAFDAGKKESIQKILEYEQGIDGDIVCVYGVIKEAYSENSSEIKLLSSSLYEGGAYLPCELEEPIKDPDLIDKLDCGRRVFVEGRISGEIDKNIKISDAKLVEYVKTNYIVGERLKEEPMDKLDQDILVSIPGGVIGYQAFYTILENVIRNAAKHDWTAMTKAEKCGRNLEVKIELEERKNKEYVICRLWTNAMDLSRGSGTGYSIPEILESENGREREGGKTPLLHILNGYLKAPIIDGDGEWKKENLGLKETKIAAGYLSSQSLRDIGYPGPYSKTLLGSFWNNETGFVKASAIWEGEGKDLIPRLGFKFKLNKPKEVFILGDMENINNCKNKLFQDTNSAVEEGVQLSTFSDQKAKEIIVDYEFCVLVLDAQDIDIEEVKGKQKQTHSTNPKDSHSVKLIRYLLTLNTQLLKKENERDDKKIDQIRSLILEEIEYYPYRFFIVLSNRLKVPRQKFIFWGQDYHELGKKNEIIKFIRSRIVFLDNKTFERITGCENGGNEIEIKAKSSVSLVQRFKLQLYDFWLSYFRRGFHKEKDNSEVAHKLYFDLGLESEAFKENLSRDSSVIMGTYQTFKDFIIKDFIEELKKLEVFQENKLKPSEIESFLHEQEPEKLPFGGQNYFLQGWLAEKTANDSGRDYREYHKILSDIFDRYREMYTKLYQKNAGEIETLPFVYRAGSTRSNPKSHQFQNNTWQDLLIDEIKANYEPYSPESNPNRYDEVYPPIGYVRHGQGTKAPYCYLDYLSGGQIFFSILKKYPSDTYAANKLIIQLVENPMAKIMIIDERVQEYVESNRYWERLSNINVIIPWSLSIKDKVGQREEKYLLGQQSATRRENTEGNESYETEIIVNAGSFDVIIRFRNPILGKPGANRETNSNDNESTQYSSLINSIVIHHSILEEIFTSQKQNPNDFLSTVNEFIAEVKLKHIPSVIVTSGKGEPKDLCTYAKFLPFSNIESFILQPRPEKFLLTQILMKTLRRRST